jgi:hypothetical protein
MLRLWIVWEMKLGGKSLNLSPITTHSQSTNISTACSSNTVSTSNLNSGSAFQFSVSTFAIGVALFIETQQTKVNATWNVQANTSRVTSSPTSSVTSSPTASTPTSTNAAALVGATGPASMMLLTGLLFLGELALE